MNERLRHVCAAARLWKAVEPDTLQLLKMNAAQRLANHVDRRERWQEGIASVAWSELPAENDLRGDPWTLVMERGTKKDLQSVQLEITAGTACACPQTARTSRRACLRDGIIDEVVASSGRSEPCNSGVGGGANERGVARGVARAGVAPT